MCELDTAEDKVLNTDVLAIYIMLYRAQLKWAGHVAHMSNKHLRNKVFYGDLKYGKRSLGGQNKRYEDYLKVSPELHFLMLPTDEISCITSCMAYYSLIKSVLHNCVTKFNNCMFNTNSYCDVDKFVSLLLVLFVVGLEAAL